MDMVTCGRERVGKEEEESSALFTLTLLLSLRPLRGLDPSFVLRRSYSCQPWPFGTMEPSAAHQCNIFQVFSAYSGERKGSYLSGESLSHSFTGIQFEHLDVTLFGCLIDKKRSGFAACFGLSARWPTETMLIWPSKKDYMYLFLIVTNNLLVKPRSLGKSEYFDPLFCDSYVSQCA